MAEQNNSSPQGYFPFAAPVNFKADYLHLVMQQGGEAARAYKVMSYDLLKLGEGMQVLDVGCGVGVDLSHLADCVGLQGQVVGLELDPDLVRVAQQAVAEDTHSQVQVVQGDAEQMPFADAHFDRVRADRAVQHMQRPERALAEMWRVLRPEGVLTLVEPDWRGIMLYPGSPVGGDDDSTLQRVLGYMQHRLPHALIGRQLRAYLHQQRGAWDHVYVQAVSFTHSVWGVADLVLQISTMARAFARENPTDADEIEEWLQAIEVAAQQEAFLASVPLFYASAHKRQANC
jgi:ubiquinone/menaquinone biosynthesis C-methylase UbiE